MNPVRSKKPKNPAESTTPKRTSNGVKLLALKPRVSEKGYALSERINTYIFDVPSSANKFDIAKAVASQFEVGVTNVRLASVPGKAVRSYRNRGRKSITGQRSDVRKAYVTLKEGDKLPIFAAVEETEAPKETK
jgi:large subunit ribosomal protein L23